VSAVMERSVSVHTGFLALIGKKAAIWMRADKQVSVTGLLR
jgi:hypothetical protein